MASFFSLPLTAGLGTLLPLVRLGMILLGLQIPAVMFELAWYLVYLVLNPTSRA